MRKSNRHLWMFVSVLAVAALLVPAGPAASASVTRPHRPTTVEKSGIAPANAVKISGHRLKSAPKVEHRSLKQRESARTVAGDTHQTTATDESTVHPLRARFTPPGSPDSDFVSECESKAAAGSTTGYVKNRMQMCRRLRGYDITYVDGEAVSGVVIDFDVIAYGRDDGTRNVTVFVKPTAVDYWGDYTLFTSVGLTTNCSGPGCGVDGGTQTHTLFAWEFTVGWMTWHLNSDETKGAGAEHVLYGLFNNVFLTKDDVPVAGPDSSIRCDSASYFGARRGKACVFMDVIPHLIYRIYNSDGSPTPVSQVAKHIRDAQNDPNATWPPVAGRDKRIPGKYTGSMDNAYLERIAVGSDTYNANRAETARACTTAPGRPTAPGSGLQCDEYPFASTQQGSANPNWDFSVRYVNGGDNSRAGTALRNYYRDDRILYGGNDFFYVQILNA